MNTQDYVKIALRMPLSAHNWAKHTAHIYDSTVTAIVLTAVREAMERVPLEIIITECQSPTGVFYTVGFSKSGHDFHEGDSYEMAYQSAREKAKALGLTVKDIRQVFENTLPTRTRTHCAPHNGGHCDG